MSPRTITQIVGTLWALAIGFGLVIIKDGDKVVQTIDDIGNSIGNFVHKFVNKAADETARAGVEVVVSPEILEIFDLSQKMIHPPLRQLQLDGVEPSVMYRNCFRSEWRQEFASEMRRLERDGEAYAEQHGDEPTEEEAKWFLTRFANFHDVVVEKILTQELISVPGFSVGYSYAFNDDGAGHASIEASFQSPCGTHTSSYQFME